MRSATYRIVFAVAGIWFLFSAVYFFLRNGVWLGGVIFVLAGAYFLWKAF